MRYKQLRNYANRRNTHVRRVRHLRDRFNPLEEYDDEAFRLRFRLRKDSVSDLVKILAKDLEHQTRRGLLLTPMQQVLIALRFYATGTFQRVIGDLFGVSVFAACRVIHKVSRAIAKQKRQFLSIPGNLADVKRKFYDVGHFPGVIGAINCTHVRVICPNKENAMAFVNHKQFYSINVQAVCDSDAFITKGSFMMLDTFQVLSGPSIVPMSGSYVQTKKMPWHLLTTSNFTPSTSKPFVIVMPLLLIS